MEIAREIVREWNTGRVSLVGAIAAAIERDRAETIERCARVAELPYPFPPDTVLCGVTLDYIADRIRSLSTPPRAEP